jgi:putative ABC transport system substrate-binding protein
MELVQLKVDAILANSSFATQAAMQATKTIPIVMTGVGNPVQSGFVASLAHPGGNVTGLTNVSIDISSKYLELLHELVPTLSRVAVLINPAHPNHPTVLKQVQAGAKAISVAVSAIEVRAVDEMGAALNAVAKSRATVLIIPLDPAFPIKTSEIVEFTNKHRMPALFGWSAATETGGLIGYQPSTAETYRRAAALVVKVLKGAKPSDIPVEFPTRFELAVNLNTAKALGIKIPNSILVRADKVIE